MTHLNWINPAFLYKEKISITNLVFGYGVAMLSLIAAMMAVMLVIANTQRFKDYKDQGFLKYFFVIYGLTILQLCAILILGILNFSSGNTSEIFLTMLALCINSIVGVCVIIMIISCLLYKSLHLN